MTVLDEICNKKRDHIRRKEAQTPLSELKKKIEKKPATLRFKKKILEKKEQGRPALIAEVKKASPSKGVIRAEFDPVKIARIYEQSGASCLSVLTDEPYFQGHDSYIHSIRIESSLPILRKDFMLTPYQIYESRALGADCVLLIMAALDDPTARTLHDTARDLEMDVLVEVHTVEEAERAAMLGAEMIGVNSRNLKTLTVSLDTAFDIVSHLPKSVVKIAESGISDHDTLTRLHDAGYDAFLVGESLMRAPDIGAAVKKLMGTS